MTNTVYYFITDLAKNAEPGYEALLESIAGFALEGYLSSEQRKVVRRTAGFQKKKLPAEFESFAEQCRALEKPKANDSAEFFEEPQGISVPGPCPTGPESAPTIDTNNILSDMLMVCAEALLTAGLKLRGGE